MAGKQEGGPKSWIKRWRTERARWDESNRDKYVSLGGPDNKKKGSVLDDPEVRAAYDEAWDNKDILDKTFTLSSRGETGNIETPESSVLDDPEVRVAYNEAWAEHEKRRSAREEKETKRVKEVYETPEGLTPWIYQRFIQDQVDLEWEEERERRQALIREQVDEMWNERKRQKVEHEEREKKSKKKKAKQKIEINAPRIKIGRLSSPSSEIKLRMPTPPGFLEIDENDSTKVALVKVLHNLTKALSGQVRINNAMLERSLSNPSKTVTHDPLSLGNKGRIEAESDRITSRVVRVNDDLELGIDTRLDYDVRERSGATYLTEEDRGLAEIIRRSHARERLQTQINDLRIEKGLSRDFSTDPNELLDNLRSDVGLRPDND